LTGFTEKQLDAFFHRAFERSEEFSTWFLARTKFAGRRARIALLRSDHPWYQSKRTGVQSETDILIVIEDLDSGSRFALHIENKLANGKFEPNQPELYHERAKDWRFTPKWGNYDAYEVVLIAPRAFRDRNADKAAIFDVYVAHEELAWFVPEFGSAAAMMKIAEAPRQN
jgi:hypothetical protein